MTDIPDGADLQILRRLQSDSAAEERFMFFCPGCQCGHWVRTRGPNPVWTWNGSMDKPTFGPSILTWWDNSRCHSFVLDGMIQFLDDCTHALKGQTVPLQPF